MKNKGILAALLLSLSLSGCMKTGDAELEDIGMIVKESTGETLRESNVSTETVTTQGETESLEETEITETEPTETEPAETEEDDNKPFAYIGQGRAIDERVRTINMKTIKNDGSGVVDVFGHDFTKAEVIKKILDFSFPDYSILDGGVCTEEDKRAILDNRNMEGIYSKINYSCSYGVLTDNADVRSFPTTARLTKEIGGKENWDYLQETLLPAGEGVAILHISSDGEYSFVQGSNYCGWIRSDYIMKCDKQNAKAFCECSDFAVVTKAYLELSDDGSLPSLRMGTALPLIGEGDELYLLLPVTEDKADGCAYQGEEGLVCTESIDSLKRPIYIRRIPVSESAVSRGYLSLNADNILSLAEGLMGCSYSWGDENEGFDCSSSIGCLYRCFGIILPRNSGQMGFTGTQVSYFTDMTAEEKRTLIEACKVGTILYVLGHVMMYDGERGLYQCVTGYRTPDGETHEPYAFVHTGLDILTRGDNTYLDLIRFAVVF